MSNHDERSATAEKVAAHSLLPAPGEGEVWIACCEAFAVQKTCWCLYNREGHVIRKLLVPMHESEESRARFKGGQTGPDLELKASAGALVAFLLAIAALATIVWLVAAAIN